MDDSIARADNPHKDKCGSGHSEEYSESSMLTLEYVLDSFQNFGLLMDYSAKIVNFERFLEQPEKFI